MFQRGPWYHKTTFYTLFLQGPLTLIDEGYNKLGEVFTVPVLHKKITFLIGPDVGSHFYKAPDSEMSQEEVRPPSMNPR